MTQIIRWGILGPGAISKKFAAGLRNASDAELLAVGSRDQNRAERFSSEFDVPRAYCGYETLAEDPDVDAVYIGTPHTFHKEHTLLCLRAGKHVLCEKPFAINAAEASEMVRVAREKKRALMEAMWMRFTPAVSKVRELVADGVIGDVRRIVADFGFRADLDPKSRIFDPLLGGGALLDVGVYPVSFAHMLLGAPSRISASVRIGDTGIDEEGAALLSFENGRQAVLTMAVRLDTPCEAFVLGSEGSIRIHCPWWVSPRLTLATTNGESKTFDTPCKGNGYTHEAEEFMNLLREGEAESRVMPLDESISVLQTLDAIRGEWGLKYPME